MRERNTRRSDHQKELLTFIEYGPMMTQPAIRKPAYRTDAQPRKRRIDGIAFFSVRISTWQRNIVPVNLAAAKQQNYFLF